MAPGANKSIVDEIRKILTIIPPSEKILDVGCGPESWLWKLGLQPVGLDLSTEYIHIFNNKSEGNGIVGSADDIPIEKDSFDSVWSIGLFHHLPDNIFKSSIKEMVRVCHKEGHVIIFDAVLPKSRLHRPIAWLLRRLDRGRYMRDEKELLSLIPDNYEIIHKQRITYSYNGLEALFLIIRK